jgi:hypothetical protein
MRSGWIAVSCVLSFGCGSSGGGDDDGDDGYVNLIEASWEVPPGQQVFCMRVTVDEEMAFDSFKAVAPPGTHHTILSFGDNLNGEPDGLTTCNINEHYFQNLAYENGLFDPAFVFPPGLANRILPGQQMILNFHILNASDSTMTGTTGIRARPIDPSLVDSYTRGIYMGKVSLSVPPGDSTHVGHCPIDSDKTIFAVLPHMHSHGTHQKVTVVPGDGSDSTVILDTPYSFSEEQHYHTVDPEVFVTEGDTVEVECSYFNDTTENLPWGPAAYDQEMCFAAVYIYPDTDLSSTACAD